MFHRLALLLLLPALVGAAPASKDSDHIRERRLAYTAAIQARQPDLMRRFLAEDMVQLSSNGEVIAGRETVVQSYSEHEFRNPVFIVYERTPDTVALSDNGRFAVERGHWRGRFRLPGGRITGNSGLYQAGWIKRQGVWLIRTESYVRLHCANQSDCPK
jgi:ketosteroid isomerase-like protein